MLSQNIALRLGAAALILIGITRQATAQPTPDDRVQQAILRLRTCQECVRGELDSVVALADKAVPALQNQLRDGLPSAARTRYRADLQSLARRGSTNDTSGSSGSLIQLQVDNADAMARIRAARALGMINTRGARQALCAARAQPLRKDVVVVLDSAIAVAQAICR
jgi:hypothetical protein